MSKRDRCYLIPVGGDSLDFIRVRASKKPDAKTTKALRELFLAAHRKLSKQVSSGALRGTDARG
jgi:hypothetical protein